MESAGPVYGVGKWYSGGVSVGKFTLLKLGRKKTAVGGGMMGMNLYLDPHLRNNNLIHDLFNVI
jgi:hypothetical protein